MKAIKTILKLQISAGKANPAPPVGPALGQHGLNIQEFCTKFNEKTKDNEGDVIPVEITVYQDRTFDFILKTPATTSLLKKEAKIEKGTGTAGKEKIAKISKVQLRKIAEIKMPDLSAKNLESAEKIIGGTARSMGIEIENS